MDETPDTTKKHEKTGMKKRAPLRGALRTRLHAYYRFLLTHPIERFVILLGKRQPVESQEALRSRQRE